MEIKLVTKSGNQAGQEVQVTKSKFLVGRDEDCHLRSSNEDVARHHCVLIKESGQVLVRDLGSKTGTFINGEIVISDRELKTGDVLKVGPLEFEVRLTTGVQGAKKPKVKSLKEAAVRAADKANSGEKNAESDIADWITPEPETGEKKKPEVITLDDPNDPAEPDETVSSLDEDSEENTPSPAHEATMIEPAAEENPEKERTGAFADFAVDMPIREPSAPEDKEDSAVIVPGKPDSEIESADSVNSVFTQQSQFDESSSSVLENNQTGNQGQPAQPMPQNLPPGTPMQQPMMYQQPGMPAQYMVPPGQVPQYPQQPVAYIQQTPDGQQQIVYQMPPGQPGQPVPYQQPGMPAQYMMPNGQMAYVQQTPDGQQQIVYQQSGIPPQQMNPQEAVLFQQLQYGQQSVQGVPQQPVNPNQPALHPALQQHAHPAVAPTDSGVMQNATPEALPEEETSRPQDDALNDEFAEIEEDSEASSMDSSLSEAMSEGAAQKKKKRKRKKKIDTSTNPDDPDNSQKAAADALSKFLK